MGRSRSSTLTRSLALAVCWATRSKSAHFLVNEIVVAPQVFLVDVQARCCSKETLDLVRAFYSLIRLQVVDGLQRT